MMKKPTPNIVISLIAYATISMSLLITGCTDDDPSKSSSVTTESNADSSQSKNTESISSSEIYVSPVPDSAPSYKLIVFQFVPYSFQDDYGLPMGYDIDIIRAIGEEVSVKFDIQQVHYDEILSLIQEGKADLAMSGLILLPERQAIMESGKPYIKTRVGHLVKASSSYQKHEDLRGKTISVLQDSPPHKLLMEQDWFEEDIIFSKSMFLSFQNVLTGKAESVATVESNVSYYAQKYSEHKIRFIPFTDYFEASVYAKKGNTELIALFNEGLNKIQKNGKYNEINKKWFGNNHSNLAIK